jgi:hypothetical protein
MVDNSSECGEWIIQRCTQRWIGTELQYEDWPGYSEHLMTRTEMLAAVEECDREWPQHEFRGHNVANQPRPIHKAPEP